MHIGRNKPDAPLGIIRKYKVKQMIDYKIYWDAFILFLPVYKNKYFPFTPYNQK